MNYYIITGTSRGLGEAMAKRWLSPDHTLICISRTRNEKLIQWAEEQQYPLEYIEFDLIAVNQIPEMFQKVADFISNSHAHRVTLVNNAGTIHPTTTIDQTDPSAISDHMALNLIAPMTLTSEFIKVFGDWDVSKLIVNISSGAGQNPYYGWSSYCSAKAGLDMFTRTVALEEQHKPFPVQIISIAPGVVDTDMQAKIRTKSLTEFQNVHRFIQLKQTEQLSSPEEAAKKVILLIESNKYGNGAILDVRDVDS